MNLGVKPTMAQNNGEAGSLKIEKLLWTYTDLAAHSSISESTLTKWVHFKKLRYPAVLKFGRTVRFDPELTMARIREIGAEYVS